MVINEFYNIAVINRNYTHYNKLGYKCNPGDTISVKWVDMPSNYNIDYLTKLVNDGKANYVLKDNGNTRINLEHKLFFRGTSLNHGDIIIRKDHETGKEIEMTITNGKDMLQPGDRLKRNGEFIKDIKYPEKRVYHLNIGDIVERKLMDGDYLLLNPKY